MAKAITQIREVPHPELEHAQAISEIMNELVENKEVILKTLRIMKGLNDTKVLDAVESMIDQRTEIGAIAIQQVNQPAMRNVIKNGMNAFAFLGSLQPGQLSDVLDGLSHGFKRLAESGQEGKKQSLWQLRKRLWSKEMRAAMTSMVNFMDGLGEVFLRNKRENS
ncbi:DUF1641 domain-containing protein [Neobacillus cucumis]|uniref:DUF1641 domain-containing protein n=1 Tax=Neobacillus cucumis TaxID=1740721 RepID=A0A2N5HVK5_9BACI|nr:DUF1641 domain-containing protein [Neobacillus cucumis]PLS09558.1 hypothetical protein CVD27_01570 [Neobacillus cucumis]